jgi:fucose permease
MGMIALAILPAVMPTPYLGMCAAIVVYAIGGGLLEVLLSPVVEALPSPDEGKAAAMSLLHSFYCWGQVAVVLGTTLVLAQVGHAAWHVLPLIWALVPLANLFLFVRVPLPDTVPETHRTTLATLVALPTFIAALVLMLCAGAAELTMSQWSSLFAEQGLGLPKVWGDIAGPCLFAVFMGIGRIMYGLCGEKIPLVPAMTACGILATACYLVAALASNPFVSLAGCAVCGLAVSLLWPGTFSLAARRFPLGGAAMFGILAVFGDAGAASGPWLAGAVAEATANLAGTVEGPATVWRTIGGLRAGILVGTVFPLIVVATTLAFGFSSRRQPAATSARQA